MSSSDANFKLVRSRLKAKKREDKMRSFTAYPIWHIQLTYEQMCPLINLAIKSPTVDDGVF